MSFFEELKRRNVVRVGVAYGIAAWVLLQVADLVLENIEAPPWVIKALLLLVLLGFIAAVVIAWAYELTPDGIKREEDVDRSLSVAPDTGRKLDRIIIGFLVLALGYFIYDKQTAVPPPALPDAVEVAQQAAAPTFNSEPSIAVLPFVNMSTDAEQEFFSDGISEELLNLLVRVDGLKVASRTSSFTYKGSSLNLADIAEELKVDHILEGSVRKADNRVRITSQLIDAKTDRHLWSETYDRELEDIFGIQDEIANAIVNALRSELGITSSGKAVTVEAATENLDAYQLFLKARSMFVARLDLPGAVALFEKAVALDPAYALAWAELSANYSVMESWGYIEKDYAGLAGQAADRALELDPSLSTPWAVKGQIATDAGDQINGVAFKQKSIELDPENATNHLWRGIDLSGLGFQQESIRSFERCLEIDPAYENCRRHMAISHMILGNNEKMTELFQQGVEAGFRGSGGVLFQRFLVLGNRMLAAQVLLGGEDQVSTMPVKAILDAAEFPEHDHARGLAKFQAWLESTQQPLNAWGSIFVIFKAYPLIEPTPFSNRWIWTPENRGFRKTTYFKEFVEQLGLPPYWHTKGFPPGCRAVGKEDFECD